jgi:hypothetical protein
MSMDLSIARWQRTVPARQWRRDDRVLEALGADLPQAILDSPPLAEVHRLDLALFVVFEEAALRVSGALTRSAPNVDAMNFSAQQTLDEARHHEIFHRRLELASAALGMQVGDARDAIRIPPLKRFLERCYEVADHGSFVDALVLMNLVLEGMAHPVYAYEERYWKPIDPYLAQLVRSSFIDEDQVRMIRASIESEHQRLIAQAGLD